MIQTIQATDGDRTGGRERGFVTSLACLHHRDKATTISHTPRTGLVISSFAISTPCPQLFFCERIIKPAGSPFHAQLLSFILIFQPKPKYSCPTISSDPYSHLLSSSNLFCVDLKNRRTYLLYSCARQLPALIPNPHSSSNSNSGPYLIPGLFLIPRIVLCNALFDVSLPTRSSPENRRNRFHPAKDISTAQEGLHIATGSMTTSMVATRQDNMSHYSNNNSSALDLDDVQTPARYIALFSIFLLFLNFELCETVA